MDVPTNCSGCGEKLRSRDGWTTGLCDVCRGTPPQWMWWLRAPHTFVMAYRDLTAVNRDAERVGSTYAITAITTSSQPVNLGEAAAGVLMLGVVGAILANSGQESIIIVVWTRRDDPDKVAQ